MKQRFFEKNRDRPGEAFCNKAQSTVTQNTLRYRPSNGLASKAAGRIQKALNNE